MKTKFYNKGQKFLSQAKRIIPGGNQLLSKRSERFHPTLWPAYYKKAKGVKIWDLDDNVYIDMSSMGVTSCVLGYSDKDVNDSIKKSLINGSMSSLNCIEEVELAKKLIDLHPWADMVRYGRSGGEAVTIALRIAKAFNNKNKILFCGYHGWHDWYLSSNIKNKKNLDGQLLPGLSTKGVNLKLSNTSIPFNYNKDSFIKTFKKHKKDTGIIIMEPQRYLNIDKELLNLIITTCKKNKIVLIFDEITSGFHENVGGLHMKYNIYPDIAVFSKALGNGTPISAVIGTKEIMDKAQDTFISSTMWTERIGFVAALSTINKMERYKIQNRNVKLGKYLKKKWQEIAIKNNIKISISGLDSMPSFSFDYKNKSELMTFFTQKMLQNKYMANGSVTISYSHNMKIINSYLKVFDTTFYEISNLIKKNKKIKIIGKKIISSDFKRLN